jgi:hypothetical protein
MPAAPLLLALISALSLPLQREPVPVHAPLPDLLETLRNEAPGSNAHQSSLGRLPELLASPQRELVEGGAFLAGEHGRGECREALVAALRRDALGQFGDQSRVSTLALDALLRLEAEIPEDVLFAAKDRAGARMVFAAVNAEQDVERRCARLNRLLGLEPESSLVRWAAAIELVRARDPRVASTLLFADPWHVTIAVVDDESATAPVDGVCGGVRLLGAKLSWPPSVAYVVVLPKLSRELEPVVVRRAGRVARDRQNVYFPADLRLLWRLRLLNGLAPNELALTEELFSPEPAAVVAKALVPALEKHIGRVGARLQAHADALAAHGLLSRSESSVDRLKWVVRVRDRRKKPAEPLVLPTSRARWTFVSG